jgi:broad specificity phosphatase PhoE
MYERRAGESEARRTGLRLILVRHAETVQNSAGVVQGRADNVLSELGRRQAAALGDWLAAEPFVAIYSSPLERARETARAVAAPHGLDVVLEPDLVEMDIGAMEGLTGPELRERHPEFLQAWLSEQAASVPMPGGGESLADVEARAGALIDRIIVKHAEGSVAVVSHNFVVLTLVCRFLALPLHSFRRLRHHVAGATIVDVTSARRTVVHFNEVCHLRRGGLLGDDPWQRR